MRSQRAGRASLTAAANAAGRTARNLLGGALSTTAVGLGLALSAAPANAESGCTNTSVAVSNATLPDATQGELYNQQIAIAGASAAGGTFSAGGDIPTGLSLSSTGLLSGIPTAKPGTYALTVVVVPAGCSASDSSTTTVTVTIEPPLAIQTESAGLPDVQGVTALGLAGAADSATTSGAATASSGGPVLTGRVACGEVISGCNTDTSIVGQDGGGYALTQWTTAYNGTVEYDTACSAGGNEPVYVKNPYNGDVIGRYIDNEVDSQQGVYTNRQSLVQCVADENTGELILVGLYPSEQGKEFYDSSGHPTGSMLEWYPYCNGKASYGPNVPSFKYISPYGYVVQDQDYWDPHYCTSGPTAPQQSSLWYDAWGQVDGPGVLPKPYKDLLGNY